MELVLSKNARVFNQRKPCLRFSTICNYQTVYFKFVAENENNKNKKQIMIFVSYTAKGEVFAIAVVIAALNSGARKFRGSYKVKLRKQI